MDDKFHPHLSLLYASGLREEEKATLGGKTDLRLPLAFPISSVHLVSFGGPVDAWRLVREFVLR